MLQWLEVSFLNFAQFTAVPVLNNLLKSAPSAKALAAS